MAKHSEYLDWLLEQLAPLGSIRARAMFGGFGLYCDELFFAIVVDDVFFVKVDLVSRSEFEVQGLCPFSYQQKDGKTMTMSYYPLPDFALETPHELQDWAKKGVAAALRAKKRDKPHRTPE